MSLIDEVCNDPVFQDKVKDAVRGRIKDAADGTEIGTPDGAYNIQVEDVSVDIRDSDIRPDPGSADDLEVDVVVSGRSTVKGIYIDGDDNQEHDAHDIEQTFEATIRIRFPSDVLEAELPAIIKEIDIEPDDIGISLEDARD